MFETELRVLSRLSLAFGALCVAAGVAFAQTPAHLRGTVASLTGDVLVVKRKGGEDATVALDPGLRVTAVVPSSLGEVKPGSFIGTAARTEPDGTLKALEVHVFPEAMRGTGEGHTPFDLGPKSTMTNGTVDHQVVSKDANTLTVRYKDGEKTIAVPPDVPVVTFEPGDRALLVPGAHVIVFGTEGADHSLKSRQIVVGKNGLTPPM